jgi:hypothetical protein
VIDCPAIVEAPRATRLAALSRSPGSYRPSLSVRFLAVRRRQSSATRDLLTQRIACVLFEQLG